MITGVQDSLMPSWPDHLPSGNQKRFWRDPRADRMAAHRKSDRRRDDLCGVGLCKRGSLIARELEYHFVIALWSAEAAESGATLRKTKSRA
jgi:hypothetical protein